MFYLAIFEKSSVSPSAIRAFKSKSEEEAKALYTDYQNQRVHCELYKIRGRLRLPSDTAIQHEAANSYGETFKEIKYMYIQKKCDKLKFRDCYFGELDDTEQTRFSKVG